MDLEKQCAIFQNVQLFFVSLTGKNSDSDDDADGVDDPGADLSLFIAGK